MLTYTLIQAKMCTTTHREGVKKMSKTEMQILATIANALARMDERDKDKFLAFSEGMAYMVDRKKDVNRCQQTK